MLKLFALTVRFEDSNSNIFHPLLRNTDVISISLKFKLRSLSSSVFVVTPLLRYARCAIFLNSNFALLVLIKCFCGNTIASLRYARCTFSLRFKLRFARFNQVKNVWA